LQYNTVVLIKAIYEDVKVDPKTLEPSTAGVKFKMEDISRNAVEEAVRIKEKHGGKSLRINVWKRTTIAYNEGSPRYGT
jgi:electron transfer flavoprotein beta subunit